MFWLGSTAVGTQPRRVGRWPGSFRIIRWLLLVSSNRFVERDVDFRRYRRKLMRSS